MAYETILSDVQDGVATEDAREGVRAFHAV